MAKFGASTLKIVVIKIRQNRLVLTDLYVVAHI